MTVPKYQVMRAQSAFNGRNDRIDPNVSLGLHLRDVVRNEINSGFCETKEITEKDKLNCEQLNGLDLKRFKARLLIKKNKRWIHILKGFNQFKYLSEAQCDAVENIVNGFRFHKNNFNKKE